VRMLCYPCAIPYVLIPHLRMRRRVAPAVERHVSRWNEFVRRRSVKSFSFDSFFAIQLVLLECSCFFLLPDSHVLSIVGSSLSLDGKIIRSTFALLSTASLSFYSPERLRKHVNQAICIDKYHFVVHDQLQKAVVEISLC
jgi:hypothetical protein